MDRGIEVPPKGKTRPSGTMSNNESGPAQLEGLFPLSHHDTELRTLFKVGLVEYVKLQQKLRLEKKKKQTYSGRGNINERGKTPLTDLDQESVVNGL